MKNAVVVYESSYGNTRAIAEAIGLGVQKNYAVRVLPIQDATAAVISGADLLLVGGPTHAHGLSRPQTRQAAADAAGKPGGTLTLDANASSGGMREWLGTVTGTGVPAAAFDTRVDAPAIFTGRASKEIGRRLEHKGFRLLVEPQSFLVSKATELLPGQTDAAQRWGEVVSGAASES